MIIIGVDTGITGGIAAIQDGKVIAIHDMPIQDKGNAQRKRSPRTGEMITTQKKEVAGCEIGSILQDIIGTINDNDIHIFIEQTTAGVYGKDKRTDQQRIQGVTSAYSMGDSFGVVRSLAEYLFKPECVHRVTPQVWKKVTKLTGLDKDAARLMARGLYPESREFLERKKDSGRADAIMIAHYGYTQLKERNS